MTSDAREVETVYVVRGVVPYECMDLLSAWVTEAAAEDEAKRLSDRDKAVYTHDFLCDDCQVTHYGDENYVVDPLTVYHRSPQKSVVSKLVSPQEWPKDLWELIHARRR